MTSKGSPIASIFGDNFDIWNTKFIEFHQKKNLFVRGLLLVLPIVFYGTLAFVEFSAKLLIQSDTCATEKGDNLPMKNR